MNEDSDNSIIEKTPEKKKLKILKPKSKIQNALAKRTESSVCDVSQLRELVEEFEKNITQKTETNFENIFSRTRSDIASHSTEIVEKVQNYIHEDKRAADQNEEREENKLPYCGITEPLRKPFSKNSHNLYVFYLIEEVLKFSPNYFPKNSHIQLVGIVNFCETSNSYILSSIEQSYFKSVEIKVDLRELPVLPPSSEKITVFCFLTFEEQVPIVVAKFFQKCTVIYSNYVELMLRLRTTVPLENFDMVSGKDEHLMSDDSLVQTMDQSDELFDILTQKLSVNDGQEPYEKDQLGDSTLYAFLDEISFEKL